MIVRSPYYNFPTEFISFQQWVQVSKHNMCTEFWALMEDGPKMLVWVAIVVSICCCCVILRF
jgi:hypothetical protein